MEEIVVNIGRGQITASNLSQHRVAGNSSGPAKAIRAHGGDQGVYTHFGEKSGNKREIIISSIAGKKNTIGMTRKNRGVIGVSTAQTEFSR